LGEDPRRGTKPEAAEAGFTLSCAASRGMIGDTPTASLTLPPSGFTNGHQTLQKVNA
jgi:hypothetical protein